MSNTILKVYMFCHFAILKDYNNDGKPDIFTYGLAGIKVFENNSNNNGLNFHLLENTLTAYYYNGYVNLYASPDDYPVIDDVDGDGKVDVLNFYVLGKHVHFLKNYATDNQSFDLRLEDECWGKFSEAADNNTIMLNSNCNEKADGPLRHTGSSLFLHDFDNNGLTDLLVGDVDSPHLILLLNGGTNESARMISQDTLFPSSCPINLFSMPAAAFIKLPNKTNHSLIVSPSDPSLNKSQDLNSVWQYDFDTTLNNYTLIKRDFLQGDMIDVGSGCYPVLYDFDNDGLIDLFLSNYGQFDSVTIDNGFSKGHFSSSISYYKNTGTAISPEFTLQTRDFGTLKNLNLKAFYPTFGDFNGDGLTDMLCGNEDGTLLFVPNSRLLTGLGEIVFNYQNIDNGEFSTPQYFDLDRDGKKDLVIGNRRGLFSYYKNVGENHPIFQKVTDTLGGVDLRNYEMSYFGYSTPCLYRDSIVGTVLFCGNEMGNISLFKNIDDNLDGTFEKADDNIAESNSGFAFPFNEGKRTGVAVYDLNGDQYPGAWLTSGKILLGDNK